MKTRTKPGGGGGGGGGGGCGRGSAPPARIRSAESFIVQMYLCAKSHENRCTIQRQQNVN